VSTQNGKLGTALSRVTVVVLSVVFTALAAASTSTQVRLILKEAEVSTALRTAMHQQMLSEKAQHPELPASTWAAVEKEIAGTQLEDDLAATWQGIYTASELEQILAFVKTPAGKKFWRTQPMVLSKMGAASGLAGFRVYGVLQRLHPDKYPRDSRSDAQIKALFEQMRSKKVAQ
jgi:hypothetical protein